MFYKEFFITGLIFIPVPLYALLFSWPRSDLLY